jgi:hypothetical protein
MQTNDISPEREDNSDKAVTHSSRIRDQFVGVRLSPVASCSEATASSVATAFSPRRELAFCVEFRALAMRMLRG